MALLIRRTRASFRLPYGKMYAMIAPAIRSFWGYVPVLILIAFVLSVIALAEPFIYGSVIDLLVQSVGAGESSQTVFSRLAPYFIAWGVVVVGGSTLSALHAYLRYTFGSRVWGEYTTRLFEKILSLDTRRFHEVRGGEMIRRFDSAGEALYVILDRFHRDFVVAVFTFLLAFGVGMAIDWRLALFALVPIPILFALSTFTVRIVEPQQHATFKIWEQGTGVAGDAFTNISTTKAFGGEKRSILQYARLFAKAFSYQDGVNRLWATTDALEGGTYIAGRLIIFAAGAWFVVDGSLSIGTLIMFLGFESQIFGAVQQVVHSLPEVSRELLRLNRMTTYWFETPAIVDRAGAKDLKRVRGGVRYDDVSFYYPDGRPILRDINFEIPDGKTVALIGASGSGKSTLAQMLLRFHDPTEGEVRFDGTDIRRATLKSVRKNVGFVMQENLLFHDTIFNNLRFAKPGATRKQVIAAAKRAQAHEFIMRLKNGYDTMAGERGAKLSGGERQRIALARVLLANPPILVLDEATSALDSKTEHDLQIALKEVMEHRTTLVIAHRLSTVLLADNIVVLHEGRIVDQGKHSELLARGGLYKQYWEIQAGGYV